MMSMDAYDATIGQSRAYGVSASGEAVGIGYFVTNQWHAFTYNYSGTYNPTTAVYSGGSWSYTDVNSLLPPRGPAAAAVARRWPSIVRTW